MQEPYRKGLANHLGPESCADGRKPVGEALTGEHAGQPLSSEITTSACRPRPDRGKATSGVPQREGHPGAAESETLSMRGSSMRENRETPGTPLPVTARDGWRRPSGRTSSVHVPGESDDLIVPTKRANKVGPQVTAESAEGRGSSKGTVLTVDHAPDTVPDQAGRFDGRATVRCLRRRARPTRATSRMR
jgi:hypothetical protein